MARTRAAGEDRRKVRHRSAAPPNKAGTFPMTVDVSGGEPVRRCVSMCVDVRSPGGPVLNESLERLGRGGSVAGGENIDE